MNVLTNLVGGLGERILAVVFAVAAAQFPLYYTAYSNTLAGAKLEAQSRLLELEAEAAKLQLNADAFIQRHEANPDAAFRASGRMHRTTLDHHRRYSSMEAALRAAPLWQRPLALAKNFDPALHAVTRFEPGLPLTVEGGVYALGGLLLAWLLTGLTGRVLGRPVYG